jgi:predicted GIY-YIG superfamily endonuclease
MAREAKPRDTYKYVLKAGNRIVHRGVTSDLKRREAEHKAHIPQSHVVQVGRRTTREQALEWERRGGKTRRE